MFATEQQSSSETFGNRGPSDRLILGNDEASRSLVKRDIKVEPVFKFTSPSIIT